MELSAFLIHLIRLGCFIILALLVTRLVSVALSLSCLLRRDDLPILIFVHDEQSLSYFEVLSLD